MNGRRTPPGRVLPGRGGVAEVRRRDHIYKNFSIKIFSGITTTITSHSPHHVSA